MNTYSPLLVFVIPIGGEIPLAGKGRDDVEGGEDEERKTKGEDEGGEDKTKLETFSGFGKNLGNEDS